MVQLYSNSVESYTCCGVKTEQHRVPSIEYRVPGNGTPPQKSLSGCCGGLNSFLNNAPDVWASGVPVKSSYPKNNRGRCVGLFADELLSLNLQREITQTIISKSCLFLRHHPDQHSKSHLHYPTNDELITADKLRWKVDNENTSIVRDWHEERRNTVICNDDTIVVPSDNIMLLDDCEEVQQATVNAWRSVTIFTYLVF